MSVNQEGMEKACMPPAANKSRRIFVKLISNSAFVGGTFFFVLLFVYGLFQTDIFTMFQFQEILVNGSAAMALAAVGEGFVIITGGLDLSVGAIMALMSCILSTYMTETATSQVFWSVVCLAIGLGIGFFNGALVAVLRLPPIIVTLATMFIVSGCALLILPAPTGEVPLTYVDFWTGAIGDIVPNSGIVLLIIILLLLFIRKSSFGMGIFSIGSDENASYMNGIKVVRTKVLAYSLAGGFYALAGIVLTANMGSGDPTVGGPLLLSTVAAVVIGGTPLGGGKGSFFGALFGAGIMNIVVGVLFVIGVSSYWGPILNGVILVVAVLVTTIWSRYVDRLLVLERRRTSQS